MVTGGSLHSFLMSAGDEYSEVMAGRHIKQMLEGVHYLHSLGIIHRDLKVENILLQRVGTQLEVKIADFGLSAICAIGVGGYDAEHSVKRKKYNSCTELWGTKVCFHAARSESLLFQQEYFAPELIDRAYGPQVDMWSLGCIAYEMLAGEPAFSLKLASSLLTFLLLTLFRKCRKEHILFDKIRRGEYSMQLGYLCSLSPHPHPSLPHRVWNEISPTGRDFVKSLLCVKPTRRLCATEALNHPWIIEASTHVESSTEDNAPPPPGAPLLKQQSLRNVADNYRRNFAEDRKLKKGGSRFNLIDALPQGPIEEKSEPQSTVTLPPVSSK
jgi:serine/threonine protein kinase